MKTAENWPSILPINIFLKAFTICYHKAPPEAHFPFSYKCRHSKDIRHVACFYNTCTATHKGLLHLPGFRIIAD